MSFLRSIKNLITGLAGDEGENNFIYKKVEESYGKMTREEVLEKVSSLVAEENLYLNKSETTIKPFHPVLQRDEETGHLSWLVTFLYERKNGKLLDEVEQTEYFWVSVDDKTGEIGEKIYSR